MEARIKRLVLDFNQGIHKETFEKLFKTWDDEYYMNLNSFGFEVEGELFVKDNILYCPPDLFILSLKDKKYLINDFRCEANYPDHFSSYDVCLYSECAIDLDEDFYFEYLEKTVDFIWFEETQEGDIIKLIIGDETFYTNRVFILKDFFIRNFEKEKQVYVDYEDKDKFERLYIIEK